MVKTFDFMFSDKYAETIKYHIQLMRGKVHDYLEEVKATKWKVKIVFVTYGVCLKGVKIPQHYGIRAKITVSETEEGPLEKEGE